MKAATKEFIKIAKQALQSAYYSEVMNNDPQNKWEDTEASKVIGEVMQNLSDRLIYTEV